MASQESSSRLTFGVTNFGPINSAKIELRPLTVFVGPSNTGKSCMATLIYALHRAVGDIGKPFARDFDPILPTPGFPSWHDLERIPDNVIQDLLAWCKESFEECHVRPSAILETKPLPASVTSTIDNIVWDTDETSASIGREIIRCFGVSDLSSLIRRNSDSRSSVNVRIASARFTELLKLNLEIRPEHLITRGTTPTTIPIRATAQKSPWTQLREVIEDIDRAKITSCSTGTRLSRSREAMAVRWLISELILPSSLGSLGQDAYYIPADRTGIIRAHTALLNSIIALTGTVQPRCTPRSRLLSGVLSDFLQALIGAGRESKREDNSNSRLSRMIETKLLGGTIHIDQTPIGYPSFSYRPMDWQKSIPLMQTSSMVSELTPIVLYLQRIVHDGDLLIIEEPESHIHPQEQVMFAKIVAEIVRHGIRVIVTTHSDWFIDQIGNLVMLSGIPSEDRHDITDGTALEKSEVGVWLFEEVDGDGNAHVTEIDVDPDTGLYPVDFGRVADSLYNESVYIFNRMPGRDHH